ncbi:hypothetical protein TNCV_682021 [Trichonephila clavipes]|nr:hypothetical protein TNCV_682021 [Trichonephila clavipes]
MVSHLSSSSYKLTRGFATRRLFRAPPFLLWDPNPCPTTQHDADCCIVGYEFESQRRHGGALKNSRAANPLVSLEEAEERWETIDLPMVLSVKIGAEPY